MATSSTSNNKQRLLRISDIVQEPYEMFSPIYGHESVPLAPLDVAVEPLVDLLPAVQAFA